MAARGNEASEEVVVYDLCIVGAGMFGSAAARHASAHSGVKVCLVGPDEPTAEERESREIFGAHYDEGRITRVMDSDIPTLTLAKESISRYRELEELSGIPFYHPVGFLYVGKRNSPQVKTVLQVSAVTEIPVVDLSFNDICRRRFPFLKLKHDDHPLLDDTGSGHISPRDMVAAQKTVARSQGCEIIPAVVNEVTPLTDGVHEVVSEHGKVRAKRVLLCTGAFTNFSQFPIPELKMDIHRETAVFFRVPVEEAERLSSMPSIVHEREQDDLSVYILPPILYPDGNYYLKIGHMDFEDRDLIETSADIRDWYLSGGDSHKIEEMSKFLTHLIPDLNYEETSSVTCVTCDSPSNQPYVDRVSPTVTVAAVGNGRGAKLSDEIGRIAAHLSLTGRWDSELSRTHFKITMKDE